MAYRNVKLPVNYISIFFTNALSLLANLVFLTDIPHFHFYNNFKYLKYLFLNSFIVLNSWFLYMYIYFFIPLFFLTLLFYLFDYGNRRGSYSEFGSRPTYH